MAHKNILDSSKAALVVIDVQEAFRSVIPEFAETAERVALAVRGFSILNIPVIVTEQYPKGLGQTAIEVTDAFREGQQVIEKTAFSSCGASNVLDRLEGVEQVVLCGLETHVCVNQTAHDLLDRGFQVHILLDAVCSRYRFNKRIGMRKMLSSGVIASSIEMAFFELMRDSKHEQFKAVQALIK